ALETDNAAQKHGKQQLAHVHQLRLEIHSRNSRKKKVRRTMARAANPQCNNRIGDAILIQFVRGVVESFLDFLRGVLEVAVPATNGESTDAKSGEHQRECG